MIAIAQYGYPSDLCLRWDYCPGNLDGKDIDLVSVFEGIGKWNHGDMTAEEVKQLECNACPGPGGCGGMYTANTMATAIEVPGLSLPGSLLTLLNQLIKSRYRRSRPCSCQNAGNGTEAI